MTVQVLWWLHEVMVQDLLLSALQSSAQVENQAQLWIQAGPSGSQPAEVGLKEVKRE